MKTFHWAISVLLILPIGNYVFGQGVAVPKRGSRPQPNLKTSTKIPRIAFEDVAPKADFKFRHVTGSDLQKKYILETTGSGVALIDYDNDGWQDVFLVNGSTLEGFPKGQEPTNHLYRNNRNGTFTDVTEKTNLVRTGWGQGVCVGDFDNDGNDDLFVTYFGQNVLYRNAGNGQFRDITQQSGTMGNWLQLPRL